MKRFGIILVVCLLAISGIMAAMAYNNATIVNSANLTIANTNQALLQLRHPAGQAGPVGSKDATYSIIDGEMFIQFGIGTFNGQSGIYGLQPNSTYEWNPLFTIANLSAEKLDITVQADNDIAGYITFGDMGQVGGGTYAPVWKTRGEPILFQNVATSTGSGMQNLRSVAVRIELPPGKDLPLETINSKIIVSAKAK